MNLGVLFDARIGGQGVSATQALMDRWGASQDSADARENGGVWISEDQKVPDARVFYANNGNGLSMLSHYVYSMTNVRLRELTLGYDLPSRWFNDKIGMTVSLVGRNLWMLYNKAPFDPEITASTGTYYQGLDYFMQPSARTIGNVEAVQQAAEKGAEIFFDETAQTPYYSYIEDGVTHEVWFEDVRSIAAKFSLIEEYGLSGAGYWQLMRLFRANWILAEDTFRIFGRQ